MAVKVEGSSQTHVVVMACLIIPIISIVCVAIRVWTRLFVSHSLGWDDYTATITLLLCITYSITIGISTNKDIGNLPEYIKWTQIADMIYLSSLLGYKISILLLYLRIFGVNKTFRYFTWLTIFFIFGYLCSNFWTQLLGCTPPSKYWHWSYAGHCIDYTKAGLAYGSMNFISDLIIFILPVPMVWHLQLSRKEKIGISLIFMSGAITCAVAIVRYVSIVRNNAADAQYFLWSILEINTGLMISCAPAFRPFLNHLKSKITSSFASAERTASKVRQRFPSKASRTHTTPADRYDDGSLVELGRQRSHMETGNHHTAASGNIPNSGTSFLLLDTHREGSAGSSTRLQQ